MSKGVNEKVSLELTLLAALASIDADVDTSEVAEIQDWTGAVRGKFYGASIKEASRSRYPQVGLPPALRDPSSANAPVFSSEVILDASGGVASHGNVQYSQMAIPQLIAVCKSESSEEAWSEFVRRFQPLITRVITKVVRQYRKVSADLVDDLVQDAFLKLCKDSLRAIRSLATAHDESDFLGFLRVVATHTAEDYFRSTASEKRGGGEALETDRVFMEHGLSGTASPEIEREILLEEIDAILKTHKHDPNFERDRAIFWLYYSQGFTAKAIAALPSTKLSVKGVESTLFRLTRQVRSALTQRKQKPK
jgi:RNA polymerase sigma factor (sigma-70 family)